MFLTTDNYYYFLRRFNQVIGRFVVLHYYCLMPNHFHFLIEVKSERDISEEFKAMYKLHYQGLKDLDSVAFDTDKFLIQQFPIFFNAYTKAFNKDHGRMGRLFMSNFKRIVVTNDRYRQKLVRNIHLNPVESGFFNHSSKWSYSSFNTISAGSQSDKSNDILLWFHDLPNFLFFHNI